MPEAGGLWLSVKACEYTEFCVHAQIADPAVKRQFRKAAGRRGKLCASGNTGGLFWYSGQKTLLYKRRSGKRNGTSFSRAFVHGRKGTKDKIQEIFSHLSQEAVTKEQFKQVFSAFLYTLMQKNTALIPIIAGYKLSDNDLAAQIKNQPTSAS